MRFGKAALTTLLVGATATMGFVPKFGAPRRALSKAVSITPTGGQLYMSTTAEPETQTYEFQAEVGKVMDIIINSLYSDRDVFLRELVSNAADACDKKRFLSLTDEDAAADAPPDIRIKADKEAGTLTIEDRGVGMTRDELVNNLGRIAQSGTKAFVEALGGQGAGDDAVNLIGQFGVGFYSAYLVADKVEVVTKSMQKDSKQLRWSSEAGKSFTIAEDDTDPIPVSGSRLILHLKDDSSDYLETSKLEDLLKRYSEFIEFPITIWKETTEYKQVPDVEANKDLPEGSDPKMKTVPQTTADYERVNLQKPVWLRSPREVTEDEYKAFYKNSFRNAYDEPSKYSHFVMEGQVECKAILYIPGMLPFELSKDMFDENSRNLRLYVKRVFINDKFEGLMPRWLKFVRGVVDSNDLPLNVSREILQRSKVLSIINKRLVRKSLDMMKSIAGDEDKSQYISFWNNFGKYLKVGIIEDDRNREEISPLLRFFSSTSGEEYTSLDEYVDNMKEGQKAIYYVTGEGKEMAAMSPVVEKLKGRGFEVLYAAEPLDEIMFESLRTYKGKDVKDAAKDTLDLGTDDEETKKRNEAIKEDMQPTVEYLETVLAGKVQKVTISTDLVDSPAALVQGAYGVSPTMQRYMRAQSVASGGADVVGMDKMNQAVMEINPKHPIVKDLDSMVKAPDGKEQKETEDFAFLMYDVASMTSGYEVKDPASFAKRVIKLMNPDAVTEDAEFDEEPPQAEEEDDDAAEAVQAEVVDDASGFD